MQALLRLFLPGAAVFAVSSWLLRPASLEAAPAALLAALSPAVFAAGLLLSWRFQRSRLFLALAGLTLAERILHRLAVAPPESARLAADAVALLVPLNVVFIALARERGVLSIRGVARLALVVAQPVLALAWAGRDAAGLARLVRQDLLPGSPPFEHIHDPALVAFAVAMAVTATLAIRRRDFACAGLFWMLLTAGLGWLRLAGTPHLPLALATGSVCLLLALMETAHHLAFRDELTGLPGRRALNEALQALGNTYAIAMVDVDHFKRFNDRHGHDVGDQVLRKVASLLYAGPGGGRAFRYGGEEFALLYPGKSVDQIQPHLERIRKSVEESPFFIRSRLRPQRKPRKPGKRRRAARRVRITVSIGAAERSGRVPTPMEVVKAADKALYKAKRAGRNRVCS